MNPYSVIELTIMGKELGQHRGIPVEAEKTVEKRYVSKTIGKSEESFGVVLRGEVVVGFDITRRFFQRALRESAHQAQTPRRKGENLEIVRQYLETEDTLREIGNRYGITGEAVRLRIRQELVALWLNCSNRTQRLFPPEYIRLRKQGLLRRSKIGIALARMLAEGKTIAEIREEIGVSRLHYARQILKRQGIEVPSFRPTKFYQELAGKLAWPNLSDAQIQELLSQVTPGFLEADRRRGYPLLTPARHLISGCGFYYRNSEAQRFINSLKAASIPVGETSFVVKSKSGEITQRHYFIAVRHTERARQALEDDPNLEKYRHNPVQQICGPQSELPTIWQLMKKRGYIPTGQVFAELGIRVRGRARIKQKDILTSEYPVPIFRTSWGGFFCRREDIEVLKDIVRKFFALTLTSNP